MEIEQVLWTAANNLSGTDIGLVKKCLRYFLKAVGVSLVWWFVVYKFEGLIRFTIWAVLNPRQFFHWLKLCILSLRKQYRPAIYAVFCCLVAAGALFCVSYRMAVSLNVPDFVRHTFFAPTEDFISKTYKVPLSQDISFINKNNLVVVLAESFERSFFDPVISSGAVRSELQPLTDPNRQNFNMVNASGSTWTIAAATGWHFGLPLKLPKFVNGNQYQSRRGFLPGAQSVFDILSDNGYETVLVMGSNSVFSGMRTLFSTHGKFKIMDQDYWVRKGWNLAKYRGTGWGFNDKFVLERAAEVYEELKKGNRPFVIFVETIDTHAKDGWCPTDQKTYQDVRDAFRWTDGNLANFVRRVDARADNNTVLGIVGDHYFMGSPAFLDKTKERKIFNAFWGAVPEVPELKQNQRFCAIDMAPTLLQAAGARWSHDQFGLGISLFAKEETMAQRLGVGELNRLMSQESGLYRKFY